MVWYICGRYSEVTKESGQLASQARDIKLACVFVSDKHAQLEVALQLTSQLIVTVPHHRRRLTQIPRSEGVVLSVHTVSSAYMFLLL